MRRNKVTAPHEYGTFLYATLPLLSSAEKSPMSMRISDDVKTKPALLVALMNIGLPIYPDDIKLIMLVIT